jgi:hypothetical protein
MLISGGGFFLALPPAVGMRRRPTAPTFVSVRRPMQAAQVNSQQNATSGKGLLRNASKCSETFRNALARMTYCLGHPAIVATIGPVIPSANLCKVLHNFVDICIRKQNFAELTPVHRWMGVLQRQQERRKENDAVKLRER